MENIEGFVSTKKFQFKGTDFTGVTFTVKKDPYETGWGTKMTFWLNPDSGPEGQALFDKFKPIIDTIPDKNDDIKPYTQYKISGSYEMKGKFANLKTFELEKIDGAQENPPQAAPTTIDQAMDKAGAPAPQPTPPEAPKPDQSGQNSLPSQATGFNTTEGANWSAKMNYKDTTIGRSVAMNNAAPIVAAEVNTKALPAGTSEMRTLDLAKRFMKFIETGE